MFPQNAVFHWTRGKKILDALFVAIRANKKCAKSNSSMHDSTVNSMLY